MFILYRPVYLNTYFLEHYEAVSGEKDNVGVTRLWK